MKDRMDRDEALAKLAAPLLQAQGGASPAECPDAGVVAGYLDRSLDEAERARCEAHFAGCSRCQTVLADLARIAPPAPQTDRARSSAGLRPWVFRWQWLAPAAAVLAVGVAWTLLRPTVTPEAPSMVLSQAPPAEPRAGAASEAEGGAAQPEARKSQPAQSAFAKDAPRPAAAPAEAVRLQAESKEVAAPAPAAKAKLEPPAVPAPAGAGNAVEKPVTTVPAETLAAQGAVGAAKPTAALARVDQHVLKTGIAAPEAGAPRLVTSDATMPVRIVSSPTQAVSWRVGPGGSIERSIDGRRTWQKQDSGTTATLLAASAPSDTVCWIVGQHGTIVRTIDGRTWEAVSPPATVDLVSVSSRDASSATVVAADGRRFVTSDGGRTWQAP